MTRAALALVALGGSNAGCHDVVALDMPPRAGGRTLIVIAARDSMLREVHVVDASVGAPAMPLLGALGDDEVAIVELRCSPAALDLVPGPVNLLSMPHPRSRFGVPMGTWATGLAGEARGAWAEPSAPVPWIDDALRRIEVAPDMACRSRGFAFRAHPVMAPNSSGLILLDDGTAVLLTPQGMSRVDARGELTELGLPLPRAQTPTTTLSAASDPEDVLWILDENGQLARARVGDPAVQYVTSSTVGALHQLAADRAGSLYAAVRTYGFARMDGKQQPLDIRHYDRRSDVWTTLMHLETPRGFGIVNMLPRERSVLVAGANAIIDRMGRVHGTGNLSELSVTAAGAVQRLDIDITPQPSNSLHQAAIAVAETQMLGLTVAAFECPESGDGRACSELASQRGARSTLVHRVGDRWALVDRFDPAMFVVGLFDAGPDAVWITGFSDFDFRSPMQAFFADGQLCPLYDDGPTTARIAPLGDGAWVVYDPERAGGPWVTVYTAQPIPAGCE